MGKIKLNLVSGAVVEKPLVNAFLVNGSSYVVLDNEMNGSMGLPIILVSKFEENKLIKIADQNEWQVVKEYLKNIIAGNKVEFIKIDSELTADDIYYTQLTLPVPSFDALKNAYQVDENATSDTLQPQTSENVKEVSEPVVPTTPINDINPIVEPQVQPITPEQPVNNDVSIMDAQVPIAPVIENTQSPINEPLAPNVENTNINQDIIQPVTPEPEITPTPIIETPTNNTQVAEQESVFKEQKEAFMKACENMFDALVSKYVKEMADLTIREQEIQRKEIEIQTKLQNANEHLANAAAREQVANIAHDNAQRVINNMPPNINIPNNPMGTQAGVI